MNPHIIFRFKGIKYRVLLPCQVMRLSAITLKAVGSLLCCKSYSFSVLCILIARLLSNHFIYQLWYLWKKEEFSTYSQKLCSFLFQSDAPIILSNGQVLSRQPLSFERFINIDTLIRNIYKHSSNSEHQYRCLLEMIAYAYSPTFVEVPQIAAHLSALHDDYLKIFALSVMNENADNLSKLNELLSQSSPQSEGYRYSAKEQNTLAQWLFLARWCSPSIFELEQTLSLPFQKVLFELQYKLTYSK